MVVLDCAFPLVCCFSGSGYDAYSLQAFRWQADTSDAARKGVELSGASQSASGGTGTLNLGTEMGYVVLARDKWYSFGTQSV